MRWANLALAAILGSLFVLAVVEMNQERDNYHTECPPGFDLYVFWPTGDISPSDADRILSLMPKRGFLCLDRPMPDDLMRQFRKAPP